jgi:hypothetical protein
MSRRSAVTIRKSPIRHTDCQDCVTVEARRRTFIREQPAAMNWILSTSAKFYRPLPIPLSILGVTIKDQGTPPDSSVTLAVNATTINEATARAKALCETVSGITRLALGSPLETTGPISGAQSAPTLSGTRSGFMQLLANVAITAAPVDAAARATLASAEHAYQALAADVARQVQFVLRWYDRAQGESEGFDKLVAAWIALETAGYGTGKKVDNILDALVPIYGGSASRVQLAGVVRPIYRSRNHIFHQANLNVASVHADAYRTLLMVEDILDEKLNLLSQKRLVRDKIIV